MSVFRPEILLSRARVPRTHSNSDSDTNPASFADAILKVFGVVKIDISIYQHLPKPRQANNFFANTHFGNSRGEHVERRFAMRRKVLAADGDAKERGVVAYF